MATAVAEIIGQIHFPGEIRTYVLGGNSKFTLVSKATGQRYTYRVKSATKDRMKNWSTGNQDRTQYFVNVLTGPNNSNDFSYMGMLRQDINGVWRLSTTRNSRVKESAESYKAFEWFWNHIEEGCMIPRGAEFWHEGICCMCGRTLTVPESIADGIGPDCKAKGGF